MRTQRRPVRVLDKLDWRIFDLLQKDRRLSMEELFEAVGLAITPCIERVKCLEREGFILGYYTRPNPAVLRASLLVFAEISLNSKPDDMFEQLRREVLCIPEVLEYHFVSGDFDYLTKARIRKMDEYRYLLGDILLQLPGAMQSKSCIVMEKIKGTLAIDITKEGG